MLFDLVKRNDLVSIIEASSYEEAAKIVLARNNCTLKDTQDNTSDEVREFFIIDSEDESDYLITTHCYETALVEALTKLNYSLFEYEAENIVRPRF